MASSSTGRAVGASVLSTLATLLLIGAGITQGVIDPSVLLTTTPESPAVILRPSTGGAQPVKVDRSVLQRDEVVIDTVKRTSGSVVSIVITRDLPRARRSDPTDPFGGLFSTPGDTQRVGGGSGFFISDDGMILTNKHVVNFDDADYTVVLSSGKELPAKVLARDPTNDIAIMKVEGTGYPALPLGDSKDIQIGQSVIAIGNALGEFQNTVSVGVVSGLARSITAGGSDGFTETLEGVLQTDAAINPGNSGGPLLNLAGEVIGINTAVAAGAQSIGFAIVINDAKQDIESVRKTGKIIRAYLGVRYVAINEAVQKERSLPTKEGALVLSGTAGNSAVVQDSPAAKAGIKEGDIITEVDGEAVTREVPLWRLIGGKSVGSTVRLTILSEGKQRTVNVTLEAQPESGTGEERP